MEHAAKQHPYLPFSVTAEGIVYSRFGKVLKPRLSNAGYARVVYYQDGKHISVLIHRLVAETFLDKTDEFVNHKDGNKLNNAVNNLEWCSRSHNVKHAIATGLLDPTKHCGHKRTIGEANGRAKLTVETVKEIREKYQMGYSRGSQPWKNYGISNVMFRNIIRGTSWRDL